MEQVYKSIGISRQAIWKWNERNAVKEEQIAQILREAKEWRLSHPKMGSRTMYYSLKAEGKALGIGVNQFEQIIRQNNLNVGKARTVKPKCSDGKGKEDYPNLTNGLKLDGICQLIVLDITYLWIGDKWNYVFSLKDVYSQWIILTPSQNLEAKHALSCLKAYIDHRGRKAVKGCIHHSDNGSQYNWKPYKETIIEYGFLISRSTKCKENGSIEQLHHISKNMYLEPLGIKSFEHLKKACKELMYKNNYKRAIKQLGWNTPHLFEESLKNKTKEKRLIKEMYDFTKNQ